MVSIRFKVPTGYGCKSYLIHSSIFVLFNSSDEDNFIYLFIVQAVFNIWSMFPASSTVLRWTQQGAILKVSFLIFCKLYLLKTRYSLVVCFEVFGNKGIISRAGQKPATRSNSKKTEEKNRSGAGYNGSTGRRVTFAGKQGFIWAQAGKGSPPTGTRTRPNKVK
jgi:hypothetical protein